MIGSIRRECLNHVVVLGERQLHRILREYVSYYHTARTHLSLGKDAPDYRPVVANDNGNIVAVPMVGGLHHKYIRSRGSFQIANLTMVVDHGTSYQC